jgi:hypothetical protein
VFIIVVVGISLASRDPASRHVQAVSTVAAIALLAVYLAWVVPYVRADAAAVDDATRSHIAVRRCRSPSPLGC